MVNKVDFMLHVTCMTYNHANYIGDTMNGFCMQQTNFPFACLIVDDASTDGEPEVIEKYIDDNFDRIETGLSTPEETDEYVRIYARHKQNKNCYFCVLLLKYNHYSLRKPKTQSVADLFKSDKYIAMCEGDDYWTDPMKLQKQVDILEAHPEYSACFHNAKVVNANGVFLHCVLSDSEETKRVFEFQDSIRGWFVPTASLVYRKSETISGITYYVNSKAVIISGDRLLIAAIASVGHLFYIPESMCIYRKHSGGISSWGDRVKVLKSDIDLYKALKKYFSPKYSKELTKRIFEWHGELALEYYGRTKYFRYIKEIFVTLVFVRSYVDIKTWIKNYLLRK